MSSRIWVSGTHLADFSFALLRQIGIRGAAMQLHTERHSQEHNQPETESAFLILQFSTLPRLTQEIPAWIPAASPISNATLHTSSQNSHEHIQTQHAQHHSAIPIGEGTRSNHGNQPSMVTRKTVRMQPEYEKFHPPHKDYNQLQAPTPRRNTETRKGTSSPSQNLPPRSLCKQQHTRAEHETLALCQSHTHFRDAEPGSEK
jgi:hypothetical protein